MAPVIPRVQTSLPRSWSIRARARTCGRHAIILFRRYLNSFVTLSDKNNLELFHPLAISVTLFSYSIPRRRVADFLPPNLLKFHCESTREETLSLLPLLTPPHTAFLRFVFSRRERKPRCSLHHLFPAFLPISLCSRHYARKTGCSFCSARISDSFPTT